jgi:hypothetical protein
VINRTLLFQIQQMNGNQVNCDDLLKILFRQTLNSEKSIFGEIVIISIVLQSEKRRKSTEMTRNFSRLKANDRQDCGRQETGGLHLAALQRCRCVT